MELMIILLLILIALDLAALRWGKDSRDMSNVWRYRGTPLFPKHHD